MKIDPDFSALADLVDQMGAERVNFVMDHADIFTETGFSVQLEEGIRDTVEWYKSNRHIADNRYNSFTESKQVS